MAIDKGKVAEYVNGYPGDVLCAVLVWYEGLLSHGVASPEDIAVLEAELSASAGWEFAGDVRYEKFGAQKSWKRVK